ncbi:MAG: hypothetical protein V4479_00235 [Actinomycetota bacterium]
MEWVSLLLSVVAIALSLFAVLRGRKRGTTESSDPWHLSISGNRFTFTNTGSDRLSDVTLVQTNGNTLTALQTMPTDVRPGGSISFDAAWTRSSPSTAQVIVTWHVGKQPTREYRATLV